MRHQISDGRWQSSELRPQTIMQHAARIKHKTARSMQYAVYREPHAYKMLTYGISYTRHLNNFDNNKALKPSKVPISNISFIE